MAGTFSTISIGLSGLQAQKKSLDTSGHNISNANTEGYSRQKTITSAAITNSTTLTATNLSQSGNGVNVDGVERIVDDFINQQINQENQTSAYWEQMSEGITKIESVFNESSDSSLNNALSDFYDSLQDLSNNPSDSASRQTVISRAEVVADSFYSINKNLIEYQKAVDENINTSVEEINSITERIADLNSEIVSVENSGQTPNDLLDERDQLLTELNSYLDIDSYQDSQGNLQITTDGQPLVSRDKSYEIYLEDSGDGQSEIYSSRTDQKIEVNSGSVAALYEFRDENIEKYIKKIDSMAEAFTSAFNEQHQEGFYFNGDTGEEFFISENEEHAALGITINSDIADDLYKIAAGTEAAAGNGENAAALSNKISSDQLSILDDTSIDDYYETIISSIGVEGQEAESMLSNQEDLLTQLEEQKESVSGVSLDEEMTNIIKYQQAYSAASKIITTTDEMLDALMAMV